MKLASDSPFIIAEIGSNWTNFHEAKDSISLAKNCGADAVKFQLFDFEALYGQELHRESDPFGMPRDWLPKLKEKADAVGIEFMCSAFSEELYDAIDPYVKTHKIASSDSTYPQLIKKAYSFGKPVIFSLGATYEADIRRILKMPWVDKSRTVFMYCVSAYPSNEYNLFQIYGLKNIIGGDVHVGFSDHSTDIYPSLSAWKHFNCPVIEKHVNLVEAAGTADAPHSLNATQFTTLCQLLKGKTALGQYKPAREEHAMFLRHNRRLIATKEIKRGDFLRFGMNFGAFRSLIEEDKGYNPLDWEYFEGKPAEKDFKIGEGICRSLY